MRRRVLFVLWGCVFLLLPNALSVAQSGPIVLEINEPYRFTLQEGALFDDLLLFQFSAPDQPVAISLRTSDEALEPALLVFDVDGNEIAQSYGMDDLSFTLPQTYNGNVYLRAGRQEWVDQGGELSVLVQTVDTQPIPFGEVVTSTLPTENHLAFYGFQASTGQLIQYGSDCDECGIVIFQQDGKYFDDTGVYENPGAYLAQIPIDGTYTLMLSSPRPNMEYELEVGLVEPQPLVSGQPMNAAIGEEPAYFSFESSADKAWVISTDLPDTGGRELRVVYLGDERPLWESVVAFDQGSGPNGNARIAPFVAPEDGIYYVMAFYFDYSGVGAAVNGTILLQPSSLLSLAPGLSLQGEITPDSGPVTYLYEGTTGEVINLALERLSGEAGLSLDVIGPEDEIVRMGGLNAIRFQPTLVLPVDGTYRIIVSAVTYEQPAITYSLVVNQE
ncbi:MAG: hypothetical protein CL607_09205 [Anaerolineaceae bacterium]|nr:hypothetical protein [Anaerolineaceae bacterium]